jgi:hypothetical protein
MYWRQLLQILLNHGLDINSGSSWHNLLLWLQTPSQLSKMTSSEFPKTLEMLFAHGEDPNKCIQGSTMWQEFLKGALSWSQIDGASSCILLLPGVMKCFLRYGADTQCPIRCTREDSFFEDNEPRTVSELIKEILHRCNAESEASVKELLALLQSEIRNVEAHDSHCQMTLNPKGSKRYDSCLHKPAPPTQSVLKATNSFDRSRPGYCKPGAVGYHWDAQNNTTRLRQGADFRRPQVTGRGITLVHRDPKMSKDVQAPSSTTNCLKDM